MTEKGSFAHWLDIQYLKWQSEEGGSRTKTAFAKYLGIPMPTLSAYMNGRRIPQRSAAHVLSEKLGDEVFDQLGMERPDPWLSYIQRVWRQLQREDQDAILDLVERRVALRKAQGLNLGKSGKETK